MKKFFPEILLFIILLINILEQIDPLFSYSLLCVYFFINFTSKFTAHIYILCQGQYIYTLYYRFSSDNIYEFKELIIFLLLELYFFQQYISMRVN